MKNKFLHSFAIIATMAILIPFMNLNADEPAAESDSWSVDYQASLQKAKAEGKRVLIDFSGSDWCHWCKVMESEVLSQQEFKDYAAKHLVLVLVDTPRKELPKELAQQNSTIKNQYNISGFPTFVLLSPDGKEIDRLTGYMRGGPQNFIDHFLKNTESAEHLNGAE